MRPKCVCVFFVAAFVSACSTSAVPPPYLEASLPPPQVEPSTITTPIHVNQEPVRAALETALKSKPLAEGQSDWIDARVLLNKKTIVQEPKRIVEVPYQAAHCEVKRVAKQITERVKVGVETFSCLIRPWEWGHCTRDVFENVVKTVWEDVRECTPERAEVVRIVMEPVIRFKEAVMPSQVRLRYKLDLEHLNLAMVGNEIEVRPRVRATIDADLKQGFLNADLQVRGALQCKADLEPSAKADVALVKMADDIGLGVTVKSVDVDVRRLCIPGAVEAVDLALLVDPLKRLIAQQLTNMLNDRLAEELQKQIDGSTGDIRFADSLRKAVAPLNGPLKLDNEIWLMPHLERLSVSQLTGGTSAGLASFDLTAGVAARPQVVYGPQPALPPPSVLPVSIGAIGDRFRLVPVGSVPLSDVGAKLDTALSDFLAQGSPSYRHIKHSTKVYQSGDKLVFALKLRKEGWFGARATVYLSGHPSFDPATNQLVVRDLAFDVSSRNVIIKFAAWLLDAKVEQYLSERARFSANELFDRTLKEFADFKIDTPSGQLSGTLAELKLGQIWIDQGALNFTVVAEGTSRFDVQLH